MSSAGLKLRPGPAGKPAVRIAGAGIAQSLDDTALIRRAQAGHWKAFADLASRYDGPILALALRLTGSEREATEFFRRTLKRAFQELPRYHFHCSFYLWLYRIVAADSLAYLGALGNTMIPRRAGRENAVCQLSPRERLVWELKHHFRLKLETVAAILDISEDSARNIFVRAVTMLRIKTAE